MLKPETFIVGLLIWDGLWDLFYFMHVFLTAQRWLFIMDLPLVAVLENSFRFASSNLLTSHKIEKGLMYQGMTWLHD